LLQSEFNAFEAVAELKRLTFWLWGGAAVKGLAVLPLQLIFSHFFQFNKSLAFVLWVGNVSNCRFPSRLKA
jgi:hypothetical protein